MSQDPPERVAQRFAANEQSPKAEIAQLEDEIEQINSILEELEGYIFQDDDSTKLHFKIRDFAAKHPDISEAKKNVHEGLRIIDRGIQWLSDACTELDQAIERREQRIEELSGR